jgi:hypothetical protein
MHDGRRLAAELQRHRHELVGRHVRWMCLPVVVPPVNGDALDQRVLRDQGVADHRCCTCPAAR